MKTASAQKKVTAKKPSLTSRAQKAPSIRANELSVLLEEIKNYISELTQAHEQLNRSMEGIINKVNAIEEKLHPVDTVAAQFKELEDEVHQIIHGHSERIAALEQRLAA
jgi:chromosome segregation ATPase